MGFKIWNNEPEECASDSTYCSSLPIIMDAIIRLCHRRKEIQFVIYICSMWTRMILYWVMEFNSINSTPMHSLQKWVLYFQMFSGLLTGTNMYVYSSINSVVSRGNPLNEWNCIHICSPHLPLPLLRKGWKNGMRNLHNQLQVIFCMTA